MAVGNCHHVCHHRQLIATLKRSQRGAIAKSQYWQCSMDLSNYLVIIWWMMTIIQKGKNEEINSLKKSSWFLLWEVTKGVRALSLSQCQYWDFRAKHKDKDHLQRNMLCHVFLFFLTFLWLALTWKGQNEIFIRLGIQRGSYCMTNLLDHASHMHASFIFFILTIWMMSAPF